MKAHTPNPLEIIKSALGSFEYRQSFAPGMFDPLEPLFKRLGYDAAGIYIADDYPDRMLLVAGYGGGDLFPGLIALKQKQSLFDEVALQLRNIPNLLLGRLFNHGRELGVVAVTCGKVPGAEEREAFDILVSAISVMAYVERIRTNICRERQERELFFAQSLANRLIRQKIPKVKNLRVGYEFVRSLEVGGDFCDLIPEPDGGLLGVIGSCSGRGLRTAMEMTGLMRETFHSLHCTESLSEVLSRINAMLVEERHRAHQASMCLFHIDTDRRRLRLAKSGRLGVLLCGPEGEINNLSKAGATFLGMVSKPEIHEDEYEFAPGQSFCCITEGFYWSSVDDGNGSQNDRFVRLVQRALEAKRKKPLANVLFDLLGRDTMELSIDNTMLALSVEFTGRNRESIRIK